MTSCPICQKPVDPLRASHIRVVAGRVVPYCSAACRDADTVRASGPLSVPVAAVSAAVAAGPSAVPQAVAPASSGKAAAVDAKSGSAPPATGKTPAVAAEPAKAGKDAKVEAVAKTDAKGDAKPKLGEPVIGAADKAKDAKDSKDAKAGKDLKSSKDDDKATRDLKPYKLGKDGKDAKPETDAKDSKDSKDSKDAKPAKPAESAKGKDAAKPAGEGDKRPPSTAGSGASKGATAVESPSSAVRKADEARPSTIPPAPANRARLVVIALVVLGLGAALIWKLASSSEPAPAPPPPKVVLAPKPAPPPPPPTFVPAEAHQRAVEVLRSQLTVESLRVRRFAAAALGRLGDPQAIQTLLDLLPNEQMEIARLDIAYGLARAGNARGLELLATGLRSVRRDVKGDAARLLAALKDPRAESTLSSLLVLSQFRLGAAEQLARLGNKQAIALLQKLRADDKAPEEDRLRATIALGYAGQADVAEALRVLLPDARFNVGAAGALAVLRDASARPTLVEQLSIPSLRVSAALALRRLEPELDASTLLYRVMPDLESSKDTERVVAAETVLLLTGPAALAERD